jgi:glycosyltransferase involved in cell wall biosynthesis
MTIPLISVILPTHNRVSLLGKAINSVLLQTERDFELIIVDDASTDQTSELLKQFIENDTRIKVIKNIAALGGGGARNVGIFASKAKWVAFLDDDDEWLENKLSSQLEEVNLSPSAVACSCSYVYNYPFGLRRKFVIPKNVSLNELYYENVLGGASVCFCSRDVLQKIHGFDTKLKSGQDWDLWVRLRKEGEIVVCDKPLVRYFAHNGLRISNDMQSQYLGIRRFYFKYRDNMDVTLRRFRICQACFVKSRDKEKILAKRFHYLYLAVYYSDLLVGLSYLKSSFPRILIDRLFCRK